jgi:glycine cleavage system regulatory protein
MASLVLTVTGDDRQGIVAAVSTAIKRAGGLWESGHFSHRGGKFAGVLLVQIGDEEADLLTTQLQPLEADGIHVKLEHTDEPAPTYSEALHLDLVGADRPGIVAEISSLLADRGVSVEELETSTEDAPMSGGLIFRANALLAAPVGSDHKALRDALEAVADELMVDLELSED